MQNDDCTQRQFNQMLDYCRKWRASSRKLSTHKAGQSPADLQVACDLFEARFPQQPQTTKQIENCIVILEQQKKKQNTMNSNKPRKGKQRRKKKHTDTEKTHRIQQLRKTKENQETRDGESKKRVRFQSVSVHEFEQMAGVESHGVPSEGISEFFFFFSFRFWLTCIFCLSVVLAGNCSLYLGDLVNEDHHIDIDDYEKDRLNFLMERAKFLQWGKKNSKKHNLYTRGRQDDFYSSLSDFQRKQRLLQFVYIQEKKIHKNKTTEKNWSQVFVMAGFASDEIRQ